MSQSEDIEKIIKDLRQCIVRIKNVQQNEDVIVDIFAVIGQLHLLKTKALLQESSSPVQ